MKQLNEHPVGKCFGSTVVGPRGQVVIPVEARKELGLDVGARLLVFSHSAGRGLLFVKVEAVEDLLNHISHQMNEFAQFLKEARDTDNASDQS